MEDTNRSEHVNQGASIGTITIRVDTKWQPPVERCLKFNIDTTWCKEDACIRVLLRNNQREARLAFIKNLLVSPTVEHAKSLEILKSLRIVDCFNYSNILLESDCNL